MTNGKLPYVITTEHLLELIRKGKPGDKLPSVRALRQQYGFATVTLNKAFQALIQNGLIETKSGRGAFIKATEGDVLTDSSQAESDQSVVLV